MKEPLEVSFYDMNEEEETALYLCDLIVDMLLRRFEEDPKEFHEILTAVINGEKIENSSLL